LFPTEEKEEESAEREPLEEFDLSREGEKGKGIAEG
jgi:hypothetical protein